MKNKNKKISKKQLCKLYGVDYKTLAKWLSSIASRLNYKHKRTFSGKEIKIIELCIGSIDSKSMSKKELRQYLKIDYKTLNKRLANTIGKGGDDARLFKNKRIFTPKESAQILEQLQAKERKRG